MIAIITLIGAYAKYVIYSKSVNLSVGKA